MRDTKPTFKDAIDRLVSVGRPATLVSRDSGDCVREQLLLLLFKCRSSECVCRRLLHTYSRCGNTPRNPPLLLLLPLSRAAEVVAR